MLKRKTESIKEIITGYFRLDRKSLILIESREGIIFTDHNKIYKCAISALFAIKFHLVANWKSLKSFLKI